MSEKIKTPNCDIEIDSIKASIKFIKIKVLAIFKTSAKIPLLELSIFNDFKAFKSDDNTKFKGISRQPYRMKNRIKLLTES